MSIDWNKPAISPEAGKRYIRRDATPTGVMKLNSFGFMTDGMTTWFQTGYAGSSGYRHLHDIIEEYIEPYKGKYFANIYDYGPSLYTKKDGAERNAVRSALRVAVPVLVTEVPSHDN